MPAFEDGQLAVFVDTASFVHQKPGIRFREREVFHAPRTDLNSLRKIVEVQYRKLVDCSSMQFAILSRAAFSQNNGLVSYEAIQPEKAIWQKPASQRETSVLLRVCGLV